MLYLGLFLLGVVFELICHPFMENFGQLIATWLEEKISWLGLQINDTNLTIKTQNDNYNMGLQDKAQPPANAIGFTIPDNEDEYEEEE